MTKGKIFKSIFIFIIIWNSAGAQSIDYSVHANIIYYLTKYMEWPDNKNAGDFVIGVVGESSLFDELKVATLNKVTRGKKIVVKSFACKQSVYNCEILIICEEESRCLKGIVASTQGSQVLIITESEGLASRGAGINFNVEDGHLILEINRKNIESKNIKIASELISLGKVVQ